MRFIAWSITLLLSSAVMCASAQTVAIDAGSLEGATDAGVSRFLGIPYAAPPVGPLRWRAPQPVVPWQGPRRADAVGASCIQPPMMSIDNASGDVRPIAEDCLFLNVWSRNPTPGAKLPVMVWIHGGALVFGSGGVPLYDGAPLAQRGAVVVGINYRLGALGFFAHPALTGEGGDVNFGLLDQIAALQWVQRNVAAFGGDPSNVTIFGQSAGAMSVLALFASPLAKGLFAKGIAQSPYGIPSHSLTKAHAVAVKVAAAVKPNSASAAGGDTTAAQLRAVPAEAFGAIEDKSATLAPGFVVGDRALPTTILGTFQKGREAKLPLIIGNTSDDGSVAVAFGVDPAAVVKKLGAARVVVRALYPPELTDAQLGRQTMRDLIFTAFERRISSLHSSRAPTWRYYFGYVAGGMRADREGVTHGADVPFTMGTLDLCQCFAAPLTAEDHAAARRTTDRWFDFARTGSPVPLDGAAWPKDGARDARLLQIDRIDEVRVDFMKRRLNAFIGTLKVLGAFSGGG
jgi:para-nitrobenzyl esterase